MMFYTKTLFFCCVLLLAFSGLTFAQGPSLNAVQGKTMIESTENLYLLDVRTAEEFAEKHLPNAINIPIDDLKDRINELPTDKTILIVCRSGRRAGVAFELIKQTRPELVDVYYLADYPIYE